MGFPAARTDRSRPSDNVIKVCVSSAEEDGKFLTAVDTALVGPGLTVPTSGVVQWEEIAGGITRDTLWDSFKIMPNTPSNLEVHTVLINHITIKEICKFARNEMGGDLAMDIMKRGWTLQQFMGKTWIITIKKSLVPTGQSIHFSFVDPRRKYLPKRN